MLNEQQIYLFGWIQTSQIGRSVVQWYFPLLNNRVSSDLGILSRLVLIAQNLLKKL